MAKITKSQRKELNDLLHKLLRLRDSGKCLRCGKETYLQLSHIFPKGKHRKMEFDPDNLILLCVGCHIYWFHKCPIEATEWIKTVLDKNRWRKIYYRANTIDKSIIDYKLQEIYLEVKIKEYETNRI